MARGEPTAVARARGRAREMSACGLKKKKKNSLECWGIGDKTSGRPRKFRQTLHGRAWRLGALARACQKRDEFHGSRGRQRRLSSGRDAQHPEDAQQAEGAALHPAAVGGLR